MQTPPEKWRFNNTLIPLPIKIAFLAIVSVAVVTFFLLFPPLFAEDIRIRIWIGMLLSILAGLVGAAMILIIYQARKESIFSQGLMKKIASQRQDLQTLFAISKTISTTMQLKPLLIQILEILMSIVDAKRGVLWLVDQTGLRRCWEVHGCDKKQCPAYMSTDSRCWSMPHTLGSLGHAEASTLSEKLEDCMSCDVMSGVSLYMAASVGYADGVKEPSVLSLGESICRNVLLKEQKIMAYHYYPWEGEGGAGKCYRQAEWASNDFLGNIKKPKIVETEGCYAEAITMPTTRIGVGLVTRNQIHGILCLGLDRIHYLTDDEAVLISNAASLAAAAIENADLYYHMEKRNQQITTLLKEAHHRIKNNLQAIAGLCTMQLQQTRDTETMRLIFDNLTRIRSISLVHQLLSQEDVKHVSLVHMGRKVVEMVIQLSNSSQKSFLYEIYGDDVKVSSQKATALALIINELTTNSIKHGFSDRLNGLISITITQIGQGRAAIEFSDNGVGLPDKFDIDKCGSLGLQLVSNLVKDDLNGVFTLSSGNGTTAKMEFSI